MANVKKNGMLVNFWRMLRKMDRWRSILSRRPVRSPEKAISYEPRLKPWGVRHNTSGAFWRNASWGDEALFQSAEDRFASYPQGFPWAHMKRTVGVSAYRLLLWYELCMSRFQCSINTERLCNISTQYQKSRFGTLLHAYWALTLFQPHSSVTRE
jgi:hypothetical protein